MRKSFVMLVLFCIGICTNVLWAQGKVSGVVMDKELNEPLAGVNVLQKGTTIGTVTDFDGKYSLEVGENAILVFSYLSMKTVEEPVNGRSVVNVSMVSDSEQLGEVVVTAMGIKRESKTLSYAAQTVGGKDLNEIKNVNMINSLQGKSAGLQITPNSTGAGGASKILFRGNKSINGSNQPLIVVDGVPLMMNVSDSQVNSNYGGGRDGGDAMSTINPDDIAQITLLKGASAAALYGAVAANGAIMITTKSASSGKVSIDVSSNTTVETVASLPKFQNSYGMSNEGTFSWGDKLSTTAPNYAKDFYQTGFTTNNSIALSGGNEHISSYFSYANVASHGVTPKNTYMSHNLLAKVGFHLWKKVHIDVSARYNNQDIENQAAAGFLGNPVTGAYLFPRGEDWDHYKNNMYTTVIDEQDYAVKPMNCPGGILVYAAEPRSYRDLPMRVGELGLVHRHEKSGQLHGLMRVRCFTQDDAHIFMTPEQIKDEIVGVAKLINEVYTLFGFEYHVELSTRPEDSMGSDEDWEMATEGLRAALDELGLNYVVNEGDGAFYGPKIDFHLVDAIGRTWQCGTIQLDFQLPQRLELEYIGADGEKHRPIMIHRVAFGSIERFIGILIEHFAGAFPTWLAPVQVKVLPISEKHMEYAGKVMEALNGAGIRAELDGQDEKIGYKIRMAQMQKIPYMLVVGQKEAEEGLVSVRSRFVGDEGQKKLEAFIADISEEIQARTVRQKQTEDKAGK